MQLTSVTHLFAAGAVLLGTVTALPGATPMLEKRGNILNKSDMIHGRCDEVSPGFYHVDSGLVLAATEAALDLKSRGKRVGGNKKTNNPGYPKNFKQNVINITDETASVYFNNPICDSMVPLGGKDRGNMRMLEYPIFVRLDQSGERLMRQVWQPEESPGPYRVVFVYDKKTFEATICGVIVKSMLGHEEMRLCPRHP